MIGQRKFLNETFNSFTDGKVSLLEVTQKIKSFIQDEPKSTYSLVVGSDSHERQEQEGKPSIQVVTAIVVHRVGFGGRYFWYRSGKQRVHSLREKIYLETLQSLDIARVFVPMIEYELDGLLHANYSLEIHVDVGQYGDTRDMIREVVGMVTGYGFVARTKPYSFAASYVADKHT